MKTKALYFAIAALLFDVVLYVADLVSRQLVRYVPDRSFVSAMFVIDFVVFIGAVILYFVLQIKEDFHDKK